jgi:acyl carrier protein
MEQSDIKQRVVKTIAQQLGMDEASVLSLPKSDWYMDSLDDIEIVMALEDEFGIEIEDEVAAKWSSLDAVVAHIAGARA